MRDLLIERSSPADEGENAEASDESGTALDPEVVQSLDAEGIEAIAAIVLVAATPRLRPLRQRERKSADDQDQQAIESVPSGTTEGEPATERLLRLALGYLAQHTESQKRMLDQFRAISVPFERMESLLKPYSSILKGQSAIWAMQRETEAFRLQSTLSSLSMAHASRGLIPSLLHEQDSFTRRLKLMDAPFSDILKTAGRISEIGRLANLSTIGGFHDDRRLWASSVSKFLNLGLSLQMIGAVAAIAAGDQIASRATIEAAGILRPGFQSVADLAMEGVVARGAATDLLHHYDVPDVGTAPLFAAVRDCVAILDDPEATESDRLSLLNKVFLAFDQIWRFLGADFQKVGLLSLIGVVASVLALFPDLQVWNENPNLSKEIRQATAQIEGMRSDAAAQLQRGETERQRTRYVHKVTNLRAEPGRNGLTIRFVYPDQWVQVLDTKGAWARVQVFNYQSTAPIEGWINRRNLRINPI